MTKGGVGGKLVACDDKAIKGQGLSADKQIVVEVLPVDEQDLSINAHIVQVGEFLFGVIQFSIV